MEFLTGSFIAKMSLFAVVFVVFLALAFNRRRAIRADSDARVQAANTLWCAICFFLAFAALYVGGTLAFQEATNSTGPDPSAGGDQSRREADFVNRPIATQKGDSKSTEAGAVPVEVEKLSPPAGGK